MKVKFLIVILALIASTRSFGIATTYGYGVVSFSSTTGIGGTVTESIQIPGTFGGVNPVDPGQGRYLQSAMIWTDSPAAGDQLTLLQIIDTDGVVPVPARGAFPNYPVIFDLLDTVSGVTPSLFIPSSGITLSSFDSSGLPSSRFIPSQLYIKYTYQAGGLGVTKTVRFVLRWGIWQ